MSNLASISIYPGGARYSTTIYFKIDFIRSLNVFTPPTLENLKGHIALGLSERGVSVQIF